MCVDTSNGLPEKLRKSNFQSALKRLAADLEAAHEVEWKQIIDEESASILSADQTTEALQITCEAINNTLRHGGENEITACIETIRK
jgi:signal transduction histidine kinase